jgi:hypothetical protein
MGAKYLDMSKSYKIKTGLNGAKIHVCFWQNDVDLRQIATRFSVQPDALLPNYKERCMMLNFKDNSIVIMLNLDLLYTAEKAREEFYFIAVNACQQVFRAKGMRYEIDSQAFAFLVQKVLYKFDKICADRYPPPRFDLRNLLGAL